MAEACEILDINDHLELPFGAIIHGRVTVNGVKKDAMCRADEPPKKAKNAQKTDISHADKNGPPKTAKYFLCKWQRLLNGGNDTIGEKGVTVERIDSPYRAQTLKLVGGAGWGALDEGPENTVNQAPKLVGRIVDYCRSRLGDFFSA